MDPKAYAETTDGSTVLWMKQKSQELNAVICGTFLLEVGGHYHNSLVWMRPDGSFELYHKRHTFTLGGENLPVELGSEPLIVELNGWHIKPMICYDIRFPVWSKNHYQDGRYEYDLGIYLANFPASRIFVWDTLLMARAIENQAYVIGVNRIGDDQDVVFITAAIHKSSTPKAKLSAWRDPTWRPWCRLPWITKNFIVSARNSLWVRIGIHSP